MDIEIILTIASLLLSSGVAAYVALRKLPTEKKRSEVDIQAIFLDVNKKVQDSYSGIIDELQDELSRLSKNIDEQRAEFTIKLSSQQTIIDDLKIRLGDTIRELDQTKKRLKETEERADRLADRLEIVEKENAKLEAENKRLRGGAAA